MQFRGRSLKDHLYLLLQLEVLELHLLQLRSLGLQLRFQTLCVALAKSGHLVLVRREREADKRKVPSNKLYWDCSSSQFVLRHQPEFFVGFKAGKVRHRWVVFNDVEIRVIVSAGNLQKMLIQRRQVK